MRPARSGRAAALVLVGLALATTAFAAPQTQSLLIPATSFTGNWSRVQIWGGPASPTGIFVPDTTSVTLFAPFDLRPGSTITGIAMQGCSGDTFAAVAARLFACDDQGCALMATAQPPLGLLSACTQVQRSAAVSLPVDGQLRYVLEVELAAGLAPSYVRWVQIDYHK